MKIWMRLTFVLAALVAGTAFAMWGEAFSSPDSGSAGSEARQEPAESKELVADPGPCGCPVGFDCIPTPRVGFITPVEGDTFRAGEAANVEVFACDLFALGLGNEDPTNLSVTCPGVSLTTSERLVQITPSGAGTCELIVTAGDQQMRGKSLGLQAKLSVPVVSTAPSVAFTWPTPDLAIVEGNLVQLSATATDSDGSVVSVTFQVRNRSTQAQIFTQVDSSAPYGANLPWTAPGNYVATARALDNEGNETQTSVHFSVNARPTITFVQPVASSFTAPANVVFEVSAADSDGSIKRVDFELINTVSGQATRSSDSLPPYTHPANGLTAASYRMRAWAFDNQDGWREATRDITVSTNPPPVVALTSPTQNQLITAPGAIELRATATDNGSITSVEFRHGAGGATLIGSGVAAGGNAFTFNWAGVPVGDYQVIARVRDNDGAVVDSAPRTLQVRTNTAPRSATLVRPSPQPQTVTADGVPNSLRYSDNIFSSNQLMSLEARFQDSEGNFDRVEFYRNTRVASNLLATVRPTTSGSTNFVARAELPLSPALQSERMQTVFAVAYDTSGAEVQTSSAPVAIHAPYDWQQIESCPAGTPNCSPAGTGHSIPGVIQAERYDLRGAGISYFDTDPYIIPAAIGGFHGNPRNDDVDTIHCGWSNQQISDSCVIAGRKPAEWQRWRVRFNQGGVYRFFACYKEEFSGSAAGAGLTEALQGRPFSHALGVGFEGLGGEGPINFSLQLTPVVDVESLSLRGAAGLESVSLPACAAENGYKLESVELPYNFQSDYAGRMTLYVPHADFFPEYFSLDWVALLPEASANDSMAVAITQPLEGAAFPFPLAQPIRIQTQTQAAGSNTFVQFFYSSAQTNWGEVLLGGDTSPPFELAWTPPAVGDYRLSARIFSTINGVPRSLPSAPVNIRVSTAPPNLSPQVTLLEPVSGPQPTGATVALRARAVDPDGNTARVEFQVSRNGSDIGGPIVAASIPGASGEWRASWTAPATAGSYQVRARAIDSATPSAVGESARVDLTVQSVPGLAHEAPTEVPATVAFASDGVGATAGTFRVDETGSATYSIPLAVVPGRAGVAPEMALAYSSQGGMGVMGRGWSIAGASSISRCRQTAEAGDAEASASGSPPLSFGESDRYCLDGQRLMLVAGSYAPNAASMEFRTEIDSLARIRAFNTDGVNGPNYFVVQAKDGTTSWYGDSISGQGLPFMPSNFAPVPRTDAALRRNDGSAVAPAANAPVLAFALTRRMDSFGNFIDYQYATDQAQGEQVLSRVEYTGKVQLNGQAGAAQPAFAALRFNYENLPVTQERAGWQAGMRVRSTKRLVSVDSLASLSSGQVIRQYRLTYGATLPISGEGVLSELRECSSAATDAVCYQPTRFGWNPGSLSMDQFFNPNLVNYTREDVKGHQLGDIDGDGLMDLVWFDNRTATPGHCPAGLPWGTQRIWTGFGTPKTIDGQQHFDLEVGTQRHACSLRSYSDLPGAWFLQDYNGDGRDDLWLADRPPAAGQVHSWQIYPSNGRSTTAQVFNQSAGLLSTCPQNDPDAANCLPVNLGNNLLVQLADVNGDGLLDAVYGSPSSQVSSPEGNVIRIKLMERSASGYAFSRAYSVRLDFDGELAECATAGQGPGPVLGQPTLRECRVRFEDPSSRWGRAPNPMDLNGDGRGDLLLMVDKIYEELCPDCSLPRPVEAGEQASSFWIPSSGKQLDALVQNALTVRRGVQTRTTVRNYHLAAVVQRIDPVNRQVQLAPYHEWQPTGTGVRDQLNPSPADLNGDGLMDLVWSSQTSGQLDIELNTGDGFIPVQSLTGIHGRDYLRVLDFDADGRADLVYPSGSGRQSSWQMRRGLADGGVSTSAVTPSLLERVGVSGLILTLDPRHGAFFFADLDGDGRTDYLDVPMGPDGGDRARLLRTSQNGLGGAGRFRPLAHVNTITNGYGAVTEITYQPLTNGAVYLREPGSRAQSASIGNGSPVQDLLGGMYVVSRVASDAPSLGNSARRSELLYQYRGARMQAGGRGMLGFREVRTIDANFDPGAGGALNHIVSITEYGLAANDPETGVVRYGFPYIGMPRESRQYRVSGAVPSGLRNCLLSGPEQTSGHCFNASGFPGNSNTFFDEPAGTLLSYARNRLAHAVTVTGIAGERSVFPYIQASFEAKGNPEATGIASLSETVNLFNYQTAWGDLANSEVSTANGASYSGLAALRTEAVARVSAQTPEARCPSARCVTRVSTVNTWLSSSQPTTTSDLNYWRLGRLEKSRVTHWRQGAHAEPASSLNRESRFEYDMSSVTRTGALTVERVAGLSTTTSAIAPNDSPSELKTIRLRDAYGNVTDTFVCSGDVPDSTCRDPSLLLQRPAGSSGLPLTRVHRHTRTEYDSQGRYPVRTLSPHFDGTPDGGLYALETVQLRDALGNVLQTDRLNGGSATATYGPLGRQQTSTDSTGAKTVSEFHWCAGGGASGQVAACPSDIGAVFRQTSYALGGTRSVTYFDRLGREVFALSESFNRYDENAANDWIGVCKTYDGRGRTVAVTEPFFVGNVAISGLRPELSTAVGCASKPSTRTTYDVLDRALTIRLPEDTGSTTVARTEMEYQGLSTTTRTHLSRATTPFATPTVVTLSEVKLHDPTGLVLTVTDAEGLEAKYAHDAAGNLVALKRNAGNGDIVSRIGYDALGRKISQNDPDAGTASYAYNAAGELICSQDARGYATVTDFDALGRSWRSQTLRSTCASTTNAATTPSNAEASILPTAATGEHSSVDLTIYDLAANGVGQIESTLRRHRVGSTYAGYRGVAADQGEFQQTSAYDSFGRPSQVTTRFLEPNLNGSGLSQRTFTQSTTYDAIGRVATTQDATGGRVENMYSAHGFLRRVRDAGQPSLVFWELLETDVRGQTTLDRRHGKVELTQKREYNEVTGRLARIVTGTWSNNQIHSAVQNLSYVFDAQGNLLSRKDERAEGREEVFVYDRLNRLIEARLSGISLTPGANTTTLTLSYDKLGNICSKNGVGYTYAGRSGCGLNGLSGGGSNSGASPHAVTARGAQAYQYDAAGNMTRTTGHNAGPGFTSTVRDVRFDGAGNADRLSISNQSTSFWYAGGGRYLRLDESSDAPAKLTRYLGGVEWILRSGGAEERRRSIGGFLLLTESVTAQQPTPTRKYRYLLTDHLGSTDTLVDENGVVVERMSFDAHGSRRAAASGTGLWASLLPAVAPTDINPQVNAETTRGFTGHEHVDRMGLIHMNGRLYDPLLGRMLSPDPIVQEPYNAQNLNRYSYVLNNPLSYTDPSGLSFVKKYWRQIVAIAISVFVPVLAPTFAASFWGAVAIGFTSGVVATGSLEGGLWGAFGAGIFHGIGIGFESVGAGNGANFDGVFNTNLTGPQFAGQVLSHATAGGVISVMQGGKFGHGFASAGISKAAGPATANAPNDFVRAGVHALIGGTASAASGGKFANGAITAAMAFAFNEAASAFRTQLAMKAKVGDFIEIAVDQNAELSAKLQATDAISLTVAQDGSGTVSLGGGGSYGFSVDPKTAFAGLERYSNGIEVGYFSAEIGIRRDGMMDLTVGLSAQRFVPQFLEEYFELGVTYSFEANPVDLVRQNTGALGRAARMLTPDQSMPEHLKNLPRYQAERFKRAGL
ncbi:MAG: VCBS repeat-containing protein [Xanthomonadales bacterium]|nr:VCBS repeat-containing protein [Xanthomonadales bacterium]